MESITITRIHVPSATLIFVENEFVLEKTKPSHLDGALGVVLKTLSTFQMAHNLSAEEAKNVIRTEHNT